MMIGTSPKVLPKYWRGGGHEIEIAKSGEEAIRSFSVDDFDLTFMDVKLPGLNGVEAFLEILKFRPDVGISMMTDYGGQELLEQAIDSGALGVLYKRFSRDELRDSIAYVQP